MIEFTTARGAKIVVEYKPSHALIGTTQHSIAHISVKANGKEIAHMGADLVNDSTHGFCIKGAALVPVPADAIEAVKAEFFALDVARAAKSHSTHDARGFDGRGNRVADGSERNW